MIISYFRNYNVHLLLLFIVPFRYIYHCPLATITRSYNKTLAHMYINSQ